MKRIPLALAGTIAAAVILALGGIAFERWRPAAPEEGALPDQACTPEVRTCPDGSTVGRTAPSCAFASCPGANAAGLWEERADLEQGAAFEYPPQLLTRYITAVDWPPALGTAYGDFDCAAGGSEVRSAGLTEERTIGGRRFCVTRQSEGAAGSVYTRYTFTTQIGDRLTTWRFTLRFVQCVNYDAPQRRDCEAERAAFDLDLDGSVVRMADTYREIPGGLATGRSWRRASGPGMVSSGWMQYSTRDVRRAIRERSAFEHLSKEQPWPLPASPKSAHLHPRASRTPSKPASNAPMRRSTT